MDGGKVEIPNMAMLHGWDVFGLQSGEVFSSLLKPEPIYQRLWDPQWSQLFPATELHEWGPCHARPIASGCECSWVNKWKQKENWLRRSSGGGNQQNDAGGKVQSIPGVYYFSELLGPYEPMCEILHPPSTSLLERMAWVRVSKPMWLPLLHFIKNPSYKGKWAQQAGKVSYQGLEEWLEGNRRDFTQTSWHMGVFGYIILKDRRIPQGLGAFQTIPRSLCLQSPNTLLHENCCSSFSAFPYESLLCNLMWLL